MIKLNALVVYKGRPAIIAGIGDKLELIVPDGQRPRVREKDIELLHPGPATDLAGVEAPLTGDVRGTWELLCESGESSVPLKELAELIYGFFTPQSAWAAWTHCREGRYFSGTVAAITPKDAGAVEAEERKRSAKQREGEERERFLERLRERTLDLSVDARFFADVEALAYGKTDKSRTMREAGLPETPLDAHKLLLSAGVWTERVNPHPGRLGLSLASARIVPPPAPPEDRVDLTHLDALAIDNAWSADPDDAVSLERDGDTLILWVHVADPASSVTAGSEADIEARGRGATLYFPEGTYRMLAEESLEQFALGLAGVSPALSFKMTLNADLSIAETAIVRSRVNVTRLTYADADAALDGVPAGGHRETLTTLLGMAERNRERRRLGGAVFIELPSVHITVDAEGAVDIQSETEYRSAGLVRECMLLAGEGAAAWALKMRLAFPYISQDSGELPSEIPPGFSGAAQIRRCMRPRVVSVKPGIHWGLGLDLYSQVTSPLRRYTDLLAHQQIRSCLRGEPPLPEDETYARLAMAEAGSQAAARAERASKAHWTMVYLSERIGSEWDGVILNRAGHVLTVIIPALGLETQTALPRGAAGDPQLNDPIRLSLASVKIPELAAAFVPK
jgi:exoribonuclease-2